MKADAIADSGERTRLACCRWRPCHRDFWNKGAVGSFGEAPKEARDSTYAPQNENRRDR